VFGGGDQKPVVIEVTSHRPKPAGGGAGSGGGVGDQTCQASGSLDRHHSTNLQTATNGGQGGDEMVGIWDDVSFHTIERVDSLILPALLTEQNIRNGKMEVEAACNDYHQKRSLAYHDISRRYRCGI